MRASSLSHPTVRALISKYFLPVWLSRDQYQLAPRAKADHQELLRIDRYTREHKMPGGSVCVFLVAPNGNVLGSLRVHEATKADKLLSLLEEVIQREKLTPRSAEAIKATASPMHTGIQNPEREGLLLHVMTRLEERRAHYGVSEDWVELSASEWRHFLPGPRTGLGDSWKVPDEVARKIVQYFYPPSPNWKAQATTVRNCTLKATLYNRPRDEGVVHLAGVVELSHPFGRDSPGVVKASVVGVIRYRLTDDTITSFQMASTEANYAWLWRGKPQPERMSIAVEKLR